MYPTVIIFLETLGYEGVKDIGDNCYHAWSNGSDGTYDTVIIEVKIKDDKLCVFEDGKYINFCMTKDIAEVKG